MKKMKSSLETWTVQQLIEHQKGKTLIVNWEYQRGAVWDERDARLLIDSVMRGYRIPLFYLRKVPRGGGFSLEVIDGQQRINSLYGFYLDRFVKGDLTPIKKFPLLLNPANSKDRKMFPLSLQAGECPWGGKSYKSMGDDLRSKFNNQKIFVAIIECEEDVARHLFIRLQRGVSLSKQQIRDAWPGDFGKRVMDLGGKEEDPGGSPANPFFENVMGLKPAKDRRGNVRKVVAQLLMSFLRRAQSGHDSFVSINSSSIDAFYREQVSMDDSALRDVERFEKLLNKLTKLFGEQVALKPHETMHLVLLADVLTRNFTNTWESRIFCAHKAFSAKVADVRKNGDKSEVGDHFKQYHRLISLGKNDAASIRARHAIYVNEMLPMLKVEAKDPRRNFNQAEREIIFDRDGGICDKCKKRVKWVDAQIHHKQPHSHGGATALDNAVLMHTACHKEVHG